MVTINRKNATIISKLPKDKLSELLSRIQSEDFVFRKKLNIPTIYSFGNEIEFNCYFEQDVPQFVNVFNDEHALYEEDRYESRYEMTAGGEIVTPILTDEQYHWVMLDYMLRDLKKKEATISDNTASHLHFGTHMINTPEELSLLIKTLVVFEPIIFRFGYGFSENPRSFIEATKDKKNYSMIMSPELVSKFVYTLDHFEKDNQRKMLKEFYNFTEPSYRFRPVFNFNRFDFRKFWRSQINEVPSIYDNMEVRCFNGTLDTRIVQNNVNLIIGILKAVHEGKIDKKYIEREYAKYIKQHYNFLYSVTSTLYTFEDVDEYNRILHSFSEIDFDKAYKLAEMIFDKDIDKLLFMKQYLKMFGEKKEVTMNL